MKNTIRNAKSVHIINPNEGVRRSILKNSKVKNQKSKLLFVAASMYVLNRIDAV
jgi:hypothetical protein